MHWGQNFQVFRPLNDSKPFQPYIMCCYEAIIIRSCERPSAQVWTSFDCFFTHDLWLTFLQVMLFLAHGQTMVGKDQKARSMIHLLGTRGSIDSENASRNATSLMEEVMERSIEFWDVADGPWRRWSQVSQLLLIIFTLSRYGLRLASMTAENEIVMVGGISHATNQMFSTMKVIKI